MQINLTANNLNDLLGLEKFSISMKYEKIDWHILSVLKLLQNQYEFENFPRRIKLINSFTVIRFSPLFLQSSSSSSLLFHSLRVLTPPSAVDLRSESKWQHVHSDLLDSFKYSSWSQQPSLYCLYSSSDLQFLHSFFPARCGMFLARQIS